MSNNRIKFNGLAELFEGLRNLPKELQAEGADIVYANADRAAAELRGEYPVRRTGLHPGPTRKSPWYPPGKLRAGVSVKRMPGQFTARAVVRNTAPHAWLYDNGSAARHLDNGKNVGEMPATHLFVKTMINRRRVMYAVLKDLLVRHGLIASGEEAA